MKNITPLSGTRRGELFEQANIPGAQFMPGCSSIAEKAAAKDHLQVWAFDRLKAQRRELVEDRGGYHQTRNLSSLWRSVMAATLSHAYSGAGRFLRKEVSAALPVFLFFLIGFLLLISLLQLAEAQFSVKIAVLSRALVGALIAAKAALLLDETPLARSLENQRRIVAVVVKTSVYVPVGVLMGYLERFLEVRHKVHGFENIMHYTVYHQADIGLFARVLGTAIVFALYFSFAEISRCMGEGALWKLFFDSPGYAERTSYSPGQ